MKYNHILLATDLSGSAKETAKKAVAMAEMFGAKLTLVHALESIPVYSYAPAPDMDTILRDQAKEEMAALAKDLAIPPEDQRIERGSVKGQVLAVAKELGVDLIVVGSHGRHGIAKLLGSSASAIVQAADCDVFVIRNEEA